MNKYFEATERFMDFAAKFSNVGLVLGSSQFSILPQLTLKTMLGFKVVKIDLNISNWSAQTAECWFHNGLPDYCTPEKNHYYFFHYFLTGPTLLIGNINEDF
jgi:hypothetical protein